MMTTSSPEDKCQQELFMQTQPAPALSVPPTERRKVSDRDIQLVQNLIERCLKLYMNQTEVITTLKSHAKIEPSFTNLVWQKLEEQNQEFFKAYYTRLKVKKQIILFNHLLEQQVQLLHKLHGYPPPNTMVQPILMQTKIPSSPMHCIPMGYSMPPALPNSLVPHMVTPPIQPPNASLISAASCEHPNGSPVSTPVFPFSNMENLTDTTGMHMGVLNMPMGLEAPFISSEPGQNGVGPLSMSPGEADSPPIGDTFQPLCHLPRKFSLSDLAAELSSADLGAHESYTGSSFLISESSAFLQSPDFEDDEKMSDLDSLGDTLNMDFDDMIV